MVVKIVNGKKHIIADRSKQSDWNETDSKKIEFIKNKPDIEKLIATLGQLLDKVNGEVI